MEKRENHIWMVRWKSDHRENRQTITVHNALSKQPLALLTNTEPNSSSLIAALEVALHSGGAPFKLLLDNGHPSHSEELHEWALSHGIMTEFLPMNELIQICGSP